MILKVAVLLILVASGACFAPLIEPVINWVRDFLGEKTVEPSWTKRQIGDVVQSEVHGSKVLFVNSKNHFGSLNPRTGEILWSKTQTEEVANIDSSGFVTFSGQQRSINIYDSDSGSIITTFSLPKAIKGTIKEARLINSGDTKLRLVVQTESSYYFFYGDELVYQSKQSDAGVSVTTTGFYSFEGGVYLSHFETKQGKSQICVAHVDFSGKEKRSTCTQYFSKNQEIPQIVFMKDLLITDKASMYNMLFYSDFSSQVMAPPKGVSYLVPELNIRVLDNEDQLKICIHDPSDRVPVCKKNIAKEDKRASYAFSYGSYQHIKDGLLYAARTDKSFEIHLQDMDKNSNINDLLLFQVKGNINFGEIDWIRGYFTEDNYRIIVQTKDLTLLYITKEGLKWELDNSLSTIHDLEGFKYKSSVLDKINPYYENLEKYGAQNVIYLIPNLVLRVKVHVSELIEGVLGLVEWSAQKLPGLLNVAELFKKGEKTERIDPNEMIQGTRQLLIFVTKANTVVAIDSKYAKTVWRMVIPSDHIISSIFKLEEKLGEGILNTKAAIIVRNKSSAEKTRIILLNPLTGSVIEEVDKIFDAVKILKIPHNEKERKQDFLMFIDKNLNLLYFPSSEKAHAEALLSKINFFTIAQTKNVIEGLSFEQGKLTKIWNYVLPSQEVIIKFDQPFHTSHEFLKLHEEGFFSALPEDKRIIFRHTDINNFVIVSNDSKSNGCNLYVISGVNGRVLYTSNIQNVGKNQPINLIFDDNGVFFSYFSTKNFIYEILSVEFFHSHIEASYSDLLYKYYTGGLEDFVKVDYFDQDTRVLSFQQTFGFPPGIKVMKAFNSKLGLTRKNLLVITESDQLYTLDRKLLSSRRPLVPGGTVDPYSFESTNDPPYTYLLPHSGLFTVTGTSHLNDIENIRFITTERESTSLLVAYGQDLYVNKYAPQKEYDSITEKFESSLVILSIVIALIGVIVVKFMAERSKVYKIFNFS